MLYLVQAQSRWTTAEGWRTSVGVPSFLLDASLQGLTGLRHATQMAVHMLKGLAPERHFSIVVADEQGEAYVYDTEKDGGL